VGGSRARILVVAGYPIKAAGGITFAQKLETAAHPDMPKSAIDTGFVDFELSPEEIAHELVRILS